jgi:hypothetical protein
MRRRRHRQWRPPSRTIQIKGSAAQKFGVLRETISNSGSLSAQSAQSAKCSQFLLVATGFQTVTVHPSAHTTRRRRSRYHSRTPNNVALLLCRQGPGRRQMWVLPGRIDASQPRRWRVCIAACHFTRSVCLGAAGLRFLSEARNSGISLRKGADPGGPCFVPA